MFTPIKFLPPARQLKRSGTLHVDFKPVLRRLHLAKCDRLSLRIVIDREMIARPETAAFAHGLWNHNLAAARKSGDHIGKQCLLVGSVKR